MQNVSSHSSLLQQAKIDIEIDAPVANTQLTQTFVNQTTDIIEAVYSFPVPRQAVIMQVVVSINGEGFTGQVKPVTEAEASYEEGAQPSCRRAGETAGLRVSGHFPTASSACPPVVPQRESGRDAGIERAAGVSR